MGTGNGDTDGSVVFDELARFGVEPADVVSVMRGGREVLRLVVLPATEVDLVVRLPRWDPDTVPALVPPPSPDGARTAVERLDEGATASASGNG